VKKVELVELLCKSAYAAWRATLNGTRDGQRVFAEMKDVRVGDLAMEYSALAFRKDYNNAIGYIEAIEPSKICGQRHLLRRLIDNKTIWWDNCDFIRVANGEHITGPFERKRKYGAQQPHAVKGEAPTLPAATSA
jgi:hypothetical protein